MATDTNTGADTDTNPASSEEDALIRAAKKELDELVLDALAVGLYTAMAEVARDPMLQQQAGPSRDAQLGCVVGLGKGYGAAVKAVCETLGIDLNLASAKAMSERFARLKAAAQDKPD